MTASKVGILHFFNLRRESLCVLRHIWHASNWLSIIEVMQRWHILRRTVWGFSITFNLIVSFESLFFHLKFPSFSRSRLLFCKVLWFKRTRCFWFLHLNFMITWYFFLMRWLSCRSSSSTDIPVRDSAWQTDCSRMLSAISDGTGLISRVSLLVYWALFKLLRSNWVIRSSRRSLQRLVIVRLELIISYFASKSLKRSFSSENFTFMSFLKFSRLKTSSISSSFDKFSTLLLVCTIFSNNLEDKV